MAEEWAVPRIPSIRAEDEACKAAAVTAVLFDPLLTANLRAEERRHREYTDAVCARVMQLLADRERQDFEAAQETGDIAAVANALCDSASARYRALEERAHQVREEATGRHPLYIRFGRARPCGYSLDYKTDPETGEPKAEIGVSTFRARRAEPEGADAVYVVDASQSHELAHDFKELWQADKRVYLAEGREVGIGSGGEPCLRDVQLAPLPEGARLSCPDPWSGYTPLFIAHHALVAASCGGRLHAPWWWWQSPPELRVDAQGCARPAEPGGP
jgi:hypothetical protein